MVPGAWFRVRGSGCMVPVSFWLRVGGGARGRGDRRSKAARRPLRYVRRRRDLPRQALAPPSGGGPPRPKGAPARQAPLTLLLPRQAAPRVQASRWRVARRCLRTRSVSEEPSSPRPPPRQSSRRPPGNFPPAHLWGLPSRGRRLPGGGWPAPGGQPPRQRGGGGGGGGAGRGAPWRWSCRTSGCGGT